MANNTADGFFSEFGHELSSQGNGTADDFFNQFGHELGQANPPQSSPFVRAMKRAGVGVVEGLVGTPLEDIGQETGIAPLQQAGGAVRQWAEGVNRENPSEIGSMGDIVQKPWAAIQEGVGNVLPQIPAYLGEAAAGAAAGAALGGPIGATIGAFAVPTLANVGQEYSQIRAKQREEGIDDKGKALAWAVPSGALETVSDKFMVGPLKGLAEGAATLPAGATIRDRLIYGAKELGKGALVEGPIEEGTQTLLERAGGGQEVFSPEGLSEAAVGSALGAIGGGVARGAPSVFARTAAPEDAEKSGQPFIDSPTSRASQLGQPSGPLTRAASAAPIDILESGDQAQNGAGVPVNIGETHDGKNGTDEGRAGAVHPPAGFELAPGAGGAEIGGGEVIGSAGNGIDRRSEPGIVPGGLPGPIPGNYPAIDGGLTTGAQSNERQQTQKATADADAYAGQGQEGLLNQIAAAQPAAIPNTTQNANTDTAIIQAPLDLMGQQPDFAGKSSYGASQDAAAQERQDQAAQAVEFKPTHITQDGLPVMASVTPGVWVDQSGQPHQGQIVTKMGEKQAEKVADLIKQEASNEPTTNREAVQRPVGVPKALQEARPLRDTRDSRDVAGDLPFMARVQTRKNPSGKFQLFFVGTRNEVFPGEIFSTAAEARRYLNGKRSEASNAQGQARTVQRSQEQLQETAQAGEQAKGSAVPPAVAGRPAAGQAYGEGLPEISGSDGVATATRMDQASAVADESAVKRTAGDDSLAPAYTRGAPGKSRRVEFTGLDAYGGAKAVSDALRKAGVVPGSAKDANTLVVHQSHADAVAGVLDGMVPRATGQADSMEGETLLSDSAVLTEGADQVINVKDIYGRTHRVRKNDLDGDKDRLPTIRKNGDIVSGEEIPRKIIQAPLSGDAASVKEPWEMTADEWRRTREAVRPDTAQSDFTKASGSQAAQRARALESLLYGVANDARDKIRAAQRGEITLSPDELYDLNERLNTPVTHRAVIEKALSKGKPVPAKVLADYPDLQPKAPTTAATTNNSQSATELVVDGEQGNVKQPSDNRKATAKAESSSAPSSRRHENGQAAPVEKTPKSERVADDVSKKVENVDTPDVLYSFAGARAKTADKYALSTVQQRLDAGEAADIRHELKRAGFGSQIDALEKSGLLEIRNASNEPKGAAAYFDGEKAVLLADRISPGEAVGKFLHEVGEHAGMREMLGERRYASVIKDFDALLASGDRWAKQAAAMVPEDTKAKFLHSERLAYLVEIVANAEESQRSSVTGKARVVVARVVSAIRAWFFRSMFGRALSAAGMSLRLQPQDIAALARASVNWQVAQEKAGSDLIQEATTRLEQFSPWTHSHAMRVTNLARKLGSELGLPTDKITVAALLHDQGKIGVPKSLLDAPRKLNELERAAMGAHTQVDAMAIPARLRRASYAAARLHHTSDAEIDQLVGLGELSRENAQIAKAVKIADIYEALTAKRPYKEGMTPAAALDKMAGMGGLDRGYLSAFASAMTRDDAKSFSAQDRTRFANGDFRAETQFSQGNAIVPTGGFLNENDLEDLGFDKLASLTASASSNAGREAAQAGRDGVRQKRPAYLDDALWHGVFNGDLEKGLFDFSLVGSATGRPASHFGAFLAVDRQHAEQHAENGAVYEVRVSILNPYFMSSAEFGKYDSVNGVVNRRNELLRQGYDGIVIGDSGEAPYAVVAFESTPMMLRMHTSYSPNVQYSRTGQAEAAMGAMFKAAKQAVDDKELPSLLASLAGHAKRLSMALMAPRTLADLSEKILPMMRNSLMPNREAMEEVRDAFKERYAKDVMLPYETLLRDNPDEADRVRELLMDSTKTGVDASEASYAALFDIAGGKERTKVLRDLMRGRGGDAKGKFMQEVKEIKMRGAFEKGREQAFHELKSGYAALTDQGKDLYRRVVQWGSYSGNAFFDAMATQINDLKISRKAKQARLAALKQVRESLRVSGPYVPMQRFGDFWVSSKAPDEAEASFDMFDNLEDQQRFIRQRKAEGAAIQADGVNLKQAPSKGVVSLSFVGDVDKMLEDLGNGPEIEAMRDKLYQMYLERLPSISASKHFLHRKKTPGYSDELFRALSFKAMHDANAISRIRYNHKLDQSLEDGERALATAASKAKLDDLREEIDNLKFYAEHDLGNADDATTRDIISKEKNLAYSELGELPKLFEGWRRFMNDGKSIQAEIARLETILRSAEEIAKEPRLKEFARNAIDSLVDAKEDWTNPKVQPWAIWANQFGFAAHLAASPAAGIVNAFQPVISMAVVGSRYGAVRTEIAFKKAYGEFFKDAAGKMKRRETMTIRDGLNGEELRAFDAIHSGIDRTLAFDVSEAGEASVMTAPLRRKINHGMGWFFQQAERLNREVTFMAAFRMAREGGNGVAPLNYADAMQYAKDIMYRTHGDYSQANRAKIMRGNTARVLTQFKAFSLMMTTLLGSSWNSAFHGATQQEKTEGRKALTGILGMQILFTGTLGLPSSGILVGASLLSLAQGYVGRAAAQASGGGLLAAAAIGLFGDDDEPWDWEADFQQFLAETFGKDAGSAIARGIIPGTIKAAGFPSPDLTARMGMQDLWFREPDKELEGEALGNYILQQLLGPAAGSLIGLTKALKLMHNEHYERGIEAMLPKAGTDLLRGLRYGAEGEVRNMRGDAIVKDVGWDEAILKMMGFNPERVAEQYAQNNANMAADTFLKARRQWYMDRYADAMREGDSEDKADIRARIQAWNAKNPAYRITGATLVRSLRARARRSTSMQNGVPLSKAFQRSGEGYNF